MKTERETTHDWERSAHCLQWAVVLAFPKILNQLNRPLPVGLLRRLLDVYVAYTDARLVTVEAGQRIDYDPTGGFRRARPAAIALRAGLDAWDGSLPPPAQVVTAARDMATAYGHPAAGHWDDHTVPSDIWGQLLWPDEDA